MKSFNRMKCGPIVVVLAALLCLVAAPVPASARPAASADITRYLPDGCQFVFSLRMRQLFESGSWKAIPDDAKDPEGWVKEFRQKLTAPPEEIDRLVVAGADLDNDEFLWVAWVRKEVSGSELVAARKDAHFRKSDVNGQTIYENEKKTDDCFAVVGGKTIVGGCARAIKAVLGRSGEPKLGPGVTAALRQADFDKTITFLLDTRMFADDDKKDRKKDKGFKVEARQLRSLAALIATAQAGDDLTLEAAALCQDAEVADDGRKLLEGVQVVFKYALKDDKDISKEAYDLIRQIKVEAKGETVRASVVIPNEVLTKVYKDVNNRRSR